MFQFLQSDLLIPQMEVTNPEKVTYGSFQEVTTWSSCFWGYKDTRKNWVVPPPSNCGIFRLSDLLQLELLWAHPVKRDEPTNAQLMYKMMMTNETNDKQMKQMKQVPVANEGLGWDPRS